MADIVTESGLSNGAIYRYFTSKDEIVVAVCEQASEAVVQQQHSAMRTAVAELVPDRRRQHAEQVAEAFVAVWAATASSWRSAAI